ncbi:hypothetical protein, partial [Mesorhizobium sp.]|uniref:hypothetical protein n=1 Tax=Mesorhizobium sp. TaxID=1871066 RepID=UPI0025B7FC8A
MVLGRKAKFDFAGLTGFLADQQRLFLGSRCDGYDPLTDNASFSRCAATTTVAGSATTMMAGG